MSDTVEIIKGLGTYIVEPFNTIYYDSRKPDGSEPVVKIGKYTSIGKNCSFLFSQHNTDWISTTPAPENIWDHKKGNNSSFSKGDIVIGNDVWIGAMVTIMGGVTIGNGAVVGACSVVTKDVEPYAVVARNPAKLIRYRFTPVQIVELERIQWWDLNRPDLMNVWKNDIDGFIKMCNDGVFN